MKTRNLRIGAMVATLVLGLVLVGAAKEWDYSGQSGYLSMSPSKLEAKPNGDPIKLLLSGMGKDGAFLEGDVHITGECGFINGVAAKTGGRAYLSGGVGSAIYRCDAATEKCCVGAQKFVAKLGSYEAGAAMSLRMDAKTSTGPDAGTTDPIGPTTFSPDKVHLLGTLSEGGCSTDVLVNFDAPNKPTVGWTCGDNVFPRSMTKRGSLLYSYFEDGMDIIAESVPDSWEKDERGCYTLPSESRKNDRKLGTCSGTAHALTDPDSDAIYINCDKNWVVIGATAPSWINETPPWHLGYEDTALVWNNSDLVLEKQRFLRKTDGTLVQIESLPFALDWTSTRAHPKGYWISAYDELWNIDFNGTATKVGDFATRTGGVLDASGVLYSVGTTATGDDYIVRIPLKPDVATTVYSEEKKYPTDACKGLFWARIRGGTSSLVTGP